MNDLELSNLIVSSDYHGQRLDQVLAALLPEYSRSQLSQWIKSGSIQLNQQSAKPKDKVHTGDRIDVKVSLLPDVEDFSQAQAENIPLTIVYEDEDLLILNKPAGLVVHPGAGNREHTLVNALLHYHPALSAIPRAGIIHRLDKDTTGLLIIAKSLIAHTALIRQMAAREIKRRYLCLVQGALYSGGHLETAFGRHPKNRLKMAVTRNGREAITDYEIEKHYTYFTLLRVELQTGRTHQIRVHMAHIGHPVVGDPLYGKKLGHLQELPIDLVNELNQWQRQALHAYQLQLTHPISQEHLTFTADLPDDFNNLLLILDAHEHSFS